MDGIEHSLSQEPIDFPHMEGEGYLVLHDEAAIEVDVTDVDVFEGIEDEDIGLIARGDGPETLQAEMLRGLERRHANPDDWVLAEAHGLADDVIDVAGFEQVLRVLVVCDEQAAIAIRLLEEPNEALEVVGGRPFADHDPLAFLDAFLRLGERRAFVVVVDAFRDVGIEVLAP